MAKHGFAVIGCGVIAQFHARAIQNIRGSRLVAGVDAVPAAAEKFAREFGCAAYTDCREMLARDDIDIITICTPSGAHLEPAVAAARAGKHVLVEKPLEITLRRCDRVIEVCRTSRVKLGVIFPSRFSDAAQWLKKTLKANRLGKLALGEARVKWWRTQAYYDSGGWRGTWKLDGGGALMNQSVHAIDLLQWLMGPVESVRAVTATRAHKRIEVEDVAVAAVRFRSGALGTIQGATAAFPGFPQRIEISGGQGSVALTDGYISAWGPAKPRAAEARVVKKLGPVPGYGSGASDPKAIGFECHRRQFVDFIKAVEGKGRHLVDGPEGRKAVEIVRAIYRSAQTNRTVKLAAKG